MEEVFYKPPPFCSLQMGEVESIGHLNDFCAEEATCSALLPVPAFRLQLDALQRTRLLQVRRPIIGW